MLKQNKDYFYNCLEVAKIGEEIVTDIFKKNGYTVKDVSDNKEWQESDVDLLVYKNNKLVYKITFISLFQIKKFMFCLKMKLLRGFAI